ncbi:hypothetical protein KC357_g482 [Hortaea werneckii]|nr:hypothetical protein KC357_g482 [Hortaea werneckii]
MEPVSLSLTVLPLLFESAVNAFRYFQLGKAYGTHVQSACITLDVARCKLSDWGEAIGLGPAPDGSLAETLLRHIVVLFEEAEVKSAKMQASQRASEESADLEATLAPGPSAHRGRMNGWWRRRQQPAGLLMDKAKWALYRKEDFEALVANVNQKVDFLVELFPMTRPAQQISHGDAHFAFPLSERSFDSSERANLRSLLSTHHEGCRRHIDWPHPGTLRWVFQSLEYNQWLGSRDEQLLLITGAKRIKKCDVDAAMAKGNLPDVFSNLYERCLHAIPEEEWEDAREMLRMLLANARPLSTPELSVLVNMSSTNPHVSDILDGDDTTEVPHFEAMLGPLVKTSDDVVMLAHQTLANFLQAQQPASMSNATRFFTSSEQSMHVEMARNCMRYLLLDDRVPASPSGSSLSSDIEDSSLQEHVAPQTPSDPSMCDAKDFDLTSLFKEDDDPVANELLALADRQKLFKYAARYWTFHFSRCREAEQEQLLDLAMRLIRPNSCSQWFAYLAMASQDAKKFPESPDPLVLASYFDLSIAVKQLLTDDTDDFNLGLAVYWAACRGSQSCLEILLASRSIDAASAYCEGVSPLAIAACNGHQDSLEMLLDTRLFDVNKQNRQGRTALSLAAGAGHEQVVARLLKEDGIDVNLVDNHQAAPAMWAAASAESSTMTLLLQYPHIDLSTQNSVGQHALAWACIAGRAQTTRLLLKDGRCDPNLQDNKGKTPLMLAISSESLPTVQVMTRHRDVNLALQDQYGRNAISWAAQSPDPRMLEYFLLHGGAPFADARDHDGWGALAWTLDPPPKPENARLLLKYASVEINVPDANGRPILSTAIEWGSMEIAQLLISSGVIDIDQPDRQGRSALAYAVHRGYTPLIVQLLTQDPSRADVPDSAGVTPRALAWENGSSQIREAFATASGSVP